MFQSRKQRFQGSSSLSAPFSLLDNPSLVRTNSSTSFLPSIQGKLNEPSHKPKLLLSAFPPDLQNFHRSKSSSTSTLFLNTTIKAPNNDEIIRWYEFTFQ